MPGQSWHSSHHFGEDDGYVGVVPWVGWKPKMFHHFMLAFEVMGISLPWVLVETNAGSVVTGQAVTAPLKTLASFFTVILMHHVFACWYKSLLIHNLILFEMIYQTIWKMTHVAIKRLISGYTARFQERSKEVLMFPCKYFCVIQGILKGRQILQDTVR